MARVVRSLALTRHPVWACQHCAARGAGQEGLMQAKAHVKFNRTHKVQVDHVLQSWYTWEE